MWFEVSKTDQDRPRVFVGSSTEGLTVAYTLQVLLDFDAEVEIWNQGTFEPGGTTLESLVRSARTFDFAVLIVTPDDTIQSRGKRRNVTRDNVLFELGLFMGALGKERVYMLYDRVNRPDLPSDLAGVTPVTYAPHKDGNLRASLGAASTELKEVFRRLGPREAKRTEVELSQPSPTTADRGMAGSDVEGLLLELDDESDAEATEAPSKPRPSESRARGGIARTPKNAVASMLGRFERYSGSHLAPRIHKGMLAAGWTPSTPAKSTYIRWTYLGARHRVSLYQNSAQLVAASNQLIDVVVGLPGADHRMPKNEVVFDYSSGVEHALAAADAVQQYANGAT